MFSCSGATPAARSDQGPPTAPSLPTPQHCWLRALPADSRWGALGLGLHCSQDQQTPPRASRLCLRWFWDTSVFRGKNHPSYDHNQSSFPQNTRENTFYMGKCHSSGNHFYSYEYQTSFPEISQPSCSTPKAFDTHVLLMSELPWPRRRDTFPRALAHFRAPATATSFQSTWSQQQELCPL